MEAILLRRLELRKNRLSEYQATINADTDTIEITRAENILHTTKELITKLDEEIKYYTKNSDQVNHDIINTALETQIQGEEFVSELSNSIRVSTSLPKERETQGTTRLPKIELPKFSGDPHKWSEFWDRFQANVHDRHIANADKFSYLLSCLEGTALEAVAGLSTSNANYLIAIEALNKRYGSTDILIDTHYSALHAIPRAENSGTSCRSTLDTIERHLRVLEKLGEPANSNHFRTLILGKFPDKVLHQLHMINNDDNSITNIRQNLNRIVVAMEKSFIPYKDTTQEEEPMGTSTEALHFRTENKFPYRSTLGKRKADSFNEVLPHKRQYRGFYMKENRPCIFCEMSNHRSELCPDVKTIEDRKRKLEGRCLNCLNKGHETERCLKFIKRCFRCRGEHLRILCPRLMQGKNHPIDIKPTKTFLCDSYTFLQTAVAKFINGDTNKWRLGRILLDSGSQRSYITIRTVKALTLPTIREDLLQIYTFGASNPQEISSPSTEIIIETKRGIRKKIQVNIVPHITDRIPVAKINFSAHNIDIPADDDSTGEKIDMLIGNDFFWSFMHNNKMKIGVNLYLINTDFGWIISGNMAQEGISDTLLVTTYCQCHTPSCPYFAEPDLPLRNIDIKFLWSLECIGINDAPKATHQEEAIQLFNETVKYNNGRYEVKWPWIQYPPEIPTNFGLAFGRLKSLIKRLNRDSLNEYNKILEDQLKTGIIERVDNFSITNNHPIHYLPHHMVKQKGKKGRIVYDASAKTTGQKSLNECLFSGPSMIEDLTVLLLKFRMKRIGIMADVEKAFLQVGLQEEDRDVTRFLWMKDLNHEPTEENLQCLRFCRVPFGVISSPFLLTATIKHHITKSNKDLLEAIADKCYVDNLVTGADSVQEALSMYEKTRRVFEDLGMNIRDWISNDDQFNHRIPKQYRASEENDVKVLGLSWDRKGDTLKIKLSEDHIRTDKDVNTKRKILSTLARIYDPCGFVCPLILPIKLLFQSLCERKVKWDAKLQEDLPEIWNMIQKVKRMVSKTEIPRFIGINSSDTDHMIHELHCFTDASKNAYAAVVYLRTKCHKQTVISLLMAKSHVSRKEERDELKIPRLELLGFLIGNRLLKYVKSNLNIHIQREYLWTDSLVVLGWVRSDKLLPPFVANRINEIKKNHQQTQMYYINTKSNPADIATRPENWDQRRKLWFNGPEFLKKEEAYWPTSRHYNTERILLLSEEAPNAHQVDTEAPIGKDKRQVKTRDENMNPEEDMVVVPQYKVCEEIQDNIPIIRNLQQTHFPDEMTGKVTQLAKNMDLFLDENKILRCKGRMANTTWNYDMKYPILLPKNSEFTNEIIKSTHESNYHVGAAHTLSIIRERYWIPQGKSQVQKIIRRCPQCIKHGGGPYKLPHTPALPAERVNLHRPFAFTGVDYFGPIFVNLNAVKEKRWVALFTCLTVRAIHLEIVNNLTAEECLLAIRRFVAIRGRPNMIYSDNATYFKLTSEVMTKQSCSEKDIKWKFIPQLAPWHGGFYERLVGLVKHCLKRTLEKHLLKDIYLFTFMKEIEAVINSRPLTQVDTEINHILRPSDFLSMGKCLSIEPAAMEISHSCNTPLKVDLIQSWKKGLLILEEFKKMFIGQYLIALRERFQHSPKQPRIKSDRTPQVGDIVQIKSDSKNRENWKVGKITTLLEGADGKCRVAKVQVGDSTFTRSIGHLYPLEADITNETHMIERESEQTEILRTELPDIYLDTESPENYIDLDRNEEIEKEIQDDRETYTDPETTDVIHESLQDQTTIDQVENNDKEELNFRPTEASKLNKLVPPLAQNTGESINKRDAAIRARKKILEWTSQLFTRIE